MTNDAEFKKNFNRLSHDDDVVKKQAVRFFCFNKNQICIEKIRAILKSTTDPKLIRWSSYALAINNDKKSKKLIKHKIAELNENEVDVIDWLKISVEILKNNSSTRHILDLLKSNTIDDVREGLVLSFAHNNKSDRLVKEILKNKYDFDGHIRKWSALTLGNTTNLRDSSLVLPYLNDTEYLVREWGAWSLANIKDINSISNLKNAINDRNPRVREWAAKALSSFNTNELSYFLINHYHQDNDIFCKEGIIRSLDPDSNNVKVFLYDEIRSKVADQSVYIKLAIIDSLANAVNIGADTFDVLYSILQDSNQQVIRDSIANLAVRNLNAKEIKILRDPKFKIITECIKESKDYINQLDSGSVILSSCDENIDLSNPFDLQLNSRIVQIVSNSVIHGNFNQIITNEVVGMGKSTQKIVDAKTISITQRSDVENSEQIVDSSTANGNIDQIVSSKQEELKIGKSKATGKLAVICLMITIVLYVILKLYNK